MSEGGEEPRTSSRQSETPAESTETGVDNDEAEGPAEQDSAIANSEAELRVIIGTLESVRSDMQQLFAMSRGSLSAEQAAGYLLISNQRMMDSTGIYMEVLKNLQDVEQIEQAVAVYDRQMGMDYSSSMNAINVIRQKAQILPATLRVKC